MSQGDRAMLPILRGGTDGDPVARQGGRIISRAAFMADIEQLAQQLPDRPQVINFCSDRYRFTVGLMAAMLRGRITLLPGSRDVAAVSALRADYPALFVLGDDAGETDAWPAPYFAFPTLRVEGMRRQILAFPADQIAAMLFTSGSTGAPRPSPRRWGRLVAGSVAAGEALGVSRYPGAAVVATVPHAHSYGLESAVMLPLQHGLLLTAERPFFPADVGAELMHDAVPPILVTTPIHLRALVGDGEVRHGGPSCRASFVLSATAPLPDALARRGEAAFNAPVLEIFGCSEAGQLATRRTVDGPVWRCLDGFRVYSTQAGCWAGGPYEADVQLADEIEPRDGGGFVLLGRTADLVNVAGKRGSLAFLTGQLLAIDGVKDGVFLMPDDDAKTATPRLTAVVIAPGLTAATILAALRERIDAAFMPRPLHVVHHLPRNDLGKLPRRELLRLAAMTQVDEPATAPPVLLRIPADHPTAPGHFPGDPIVPGAVLLDELIGALFADNWSGHVDSAKFHQPVRPGDVVTVTHQTEGQATRFECRCLKSGNVVLSGVLRTTFPAL